METFTMSRKELVRPGLIKAAVEGRITDRQAAKGRRPGVLRSGRYSKPGSSFAP
jgi:hypothetical protein